jgi:IMP dehydrogenase
MRFLHPQRDEQLELSLEDVFLVPDYFDGTSRLEVDLTPVDFRGGSHPIVSANMNAVTGKRMAETMARFGGLGVLPQDMEMRTVERIVKHIRSADPRYDTALAVGRLATLHDVHGIIHKRSHNLVVVVDDSERPVGIVTDANLRQQDQYTLVERLMSSEIITVRAGTPNRDAFLLMERTRVKAVPVLDGDGRLVGVLTRDDAVRMDLLSPSLDPSGKLMVACAVGISGEAPEQARRLADLGISAIVLDTAHGHQRRMVEAIRGVRAALGDRLPIVAGNVCTAEGTRALIEAGADVVKVNVGPGAMCTTRMQTAVGRPTFSSVLACAREARRLGKHVWADGGVRDPRDVALYLAAGASRVMVGTMLAGTYESPGDVREDRDGRLYKESYGMASGRAVSDRTIGLDPFERAKKGFFREGVSTSRVYLKAGRESVSEILLEILTGLQSAFTYAGAMRCEDFHARAAVGVQTPGGFHEGKPHGGLR